MRSIENLCQCCGRAQSETISCVSETEAKLHGIVVKLKNKTSFIAGLLFLCAMLQAAAMAEAAGPLPIVPPNYQYGSSSGSGRTGTSYYNSGSQRRQRPAISRPPVSSSRSTQNVGASASQGQSPSYSSILSQRGEAAGAAIDARMLENGLDFGNARWTTGPDGSRVATFPDGTQLEYHRDGSGALYHPREQPAIRQSDQQPTTSQRNTAADNAETSNSAAISSANQDGRQIGMTPNRSDTNGIGTVPSPQSRIAAGESMQPVSGQTDNQPQEDVYGVYTSDGVQGPRPLVPPGGNTTDTIQPSGSSRFGTPAFLPAGGNSAISNIMAPAGDLSNWGRSLQPDAAINRGNQPIAPYGGAQTATARMPRSSQSYSNAIGAGSTYRMPPELQNSASAGQIPAEILSPRVNGGTNGEGPGPVPGPGNNPDNIPFDGQGGYLPPAQQNTLQGNNARNRISVSSANRDYDWSDLIGDASGLLGAAWAEQLGGDEAAIIGGGMVGRMLRGQASRSGGIDGNRPGAVPEEIASDAVRGAEIGSEWSAASQSR